MLRRLKAKARDAFPRSADEHAQDVVRLLQHRRAVMDATWEELEKGWKTNNERMVEFGLTPRTFEEGMVKLNVGGSKVNVCWHLLAETGPPGLEDSTLGALLEGVWGKGCVPRDADGRIVLDESPACFKHTINTMLAGRARSAVVVGLPESAAHSAVAIDEVPCLIYTAHVMGLPGYVPTHPRYLKMSGGSTVLEPFEIAPFGAKIREWVGGSPEHLTLIYRATRDGFDTKSFKPTCDEDSPHVVSLIRVRSGKGSNNDSVVGGYSVLPFGSVVGSKYTITAATFMFMLKDGSAARKDPSKPIKWNPYPKGVGKQYTLTKRSGACVGGNDLCTAFDETTGGGTFCTGRETFAIEEDSPLLALQGNKVVDIEVYRYSKSAPPTTAIAPSITEPGGDVLTNADAHDVRLFGESIATALMEERVVLDHAVKEMEGAAARVSAAVGALETVYGPSVAAGEQDAVVELNVRGTRMTTLRSTLRACPRSALAAMFNEERWPPTNKDKDQHGGRLIDCNATCFSKILDVLRMRKRASWSRGVEEGTHEEENDGGGGREDQRKEEKESSIDGSGAVLIKEADVEAFRESVNMYFPGCESFIMGMVQCV